MPTCSLQAAVCRCGRALQLAAAQDKLLLRLHLGSSSSWASHCLSAASHTALPTSIAHLPRRLRPCPAHCPGPQRQSPPAGCPGGGTPRAPTRTLPEGGSCPATLRPLRGAGPSAPAGRRGPQTADTATGSAVQGGGSGAAQPVQLVPGCMMHAQLEGKSLCEDAEHVLITAAAPSKLSCSCFHSFSRPGKLTDASCCCAVWDHPPAQPQEHSMWGRRARGSSGAADCGGPC